MPKDIQNCRFAVSAGETYITVHVEYIGCKYSAHLQYSTWIYPVKFSLRDHRPCTAKLNSILSSGMQSDFRDELLVLLSRRACSILGVSISGCSTYSHRKSVILLPVPILVFRAHIHVFVHLMPLCGNKHWSAVPTQADLVHENKYAKNLKASNAFICVRPLAFLKTFRKRNMCFIRACLVPAFLIIWRTVPEKQCRYRGLEYFIVNFAVSLVKRLLYLTLLERPVSAESVGALSLDVKALEPLVMCFHCFFLDGTSVKVAILEARGQNLFREQHS